MSEKIRLDRCINPFRRPGEKGHVGKDLRTISRSFRQNFPDLPKNCKICSDCRKNKEVNLYNSSGSMNENLGSNLDMEIDENSRDNRNIESMENSDEKYVEGSSITYMSNPESPLKSQSRSLREIELEELFDGLKEKYASLDKNDPMKLRILTIAPASWSIRKISQEFGASRYLAKKSKGLRSSQGVLAETTAKVGKTISASIIQEIDEFYNSDSNSRIMPGMKDTITVKVYGECTKVQKRLLLFSLKELHALFKESHPEKTVSFSASAKLRPKHCILAGSNGTHSVCVCTIHQNCKFMLDAINVQKLTEKYDKPIRDYKYCLNFLTCEPPTPDCYLDNCDN